MEHLVSISDASNRVKWRGQLIGGVRYGSIANLVKEWRSIEMDKVQGMDCITFDNNGMQ